MFPIWSSPKARSVNVSLPSWLASHNSCACSGVTDSVTHETPSSSGGAPRTEGS